MFPELSFYNPIVFVKVRKSQREIVVSSNAPKKLTKFFPNGLNGSNQKNKDTFLC